MRSGVSSVDPVSQITQAVITGASDARQRSILAASFFTIMLRHSLAAMIEAAGRTTHEFTRRGVTDALHCARIHNAGIMHPLGTADHAHHPDHQAGT
jgi:hypothetical protein